MGSVLEQPVALGVGAHPRHAFAAAGGTLALLKQRGWQVVVASLTAGEPRADDAAAGQPSLREAEGRRAAAALEADWRCCDLPHFGVFYEAGACQRVVGLLRSVRPAVVFTHRVEDPGPDAEPTARLVRQACVAAPARGYRASGDDEATARVPHLYAFDPAELMTGLGDKLAASLIADTSTTQRIKEQAVVQFGGSDGRAGDTPAVEAALETARRCARYRAEAAGLGFAEGFSQHIAPPFPQDDLLRDVLGDLVRRS